MKFRFDHTALGVLVSAFVLVVALFLWITPETRAGTSTPPVEWTRQFGTGSIEDTGNAAADASGLYVGGGAGDFPDADDSEGTGVFVRKYSPTGSVAWTSQFDGGGSVRAAGVALHSTGVYVGGRTNGTVSGGTPVGKDDAFIRKYDLNGNVLWTKQFGTTEYEEVVAGNIDADSSGVYLTGYTDGTFPGEQKCDTSAFCSDGWLSKHDHDGNLLWVRQFRVDNKAPDPQGLSANGSGVYVVGSAEGEQFVRKYDTNGTEQWTTPFSTAGSDSTYNVFDSPEGVYVAGQTNGELPEQTNLGGYDAFLLKFEHEGGEHVWTRQFGTSETDAIWTVHAVSSGVYVAGETRGSFAALNQGQGDAFIRKYTHQGNPVWTDQFGSSGEEDTYGLAVVDNLVYMVGETTGELPGQTHEGNTDLFARQYAEYVPLPSLSPTPTPTPIPTPTPTPIGQTPTPTPTPTGQTPTPTPTPTPTGQTPTPTPTPTPTATPTPTPTGPPEGLVQGDNDCDGDRDAVDALVSLQSTAGVPYNQQPGCLELGSAVPAGDQAQLFGDIDCDGDVDAVDALQILRFVAGLPVNQEDGCTPIGEDL